MSATKWYIADPGLVIDLLVNKEVFTYDDDASWPDITRHLDKHMSSFVDRIYVLSDYMIQAEVHLVESQCLLEVSCVYGAEVLIQVSIVNFKAGELRIFDTYVDTHHRQRNYVRLKGFKRA